MAKHKQNYSFPPGIPEWQDIQVLWLFILSRNPTSLQTTVTPITRHIPAESTQKSDVHFLAPRTITERATEARQEKNNINSSNQCTE